MKISDILKNAAGILQSRGIAESRREANSLLAFTLQKDKAFLIAHSDYELSDEEEKRFREFLRRRASGEPFQYIAEKQEFFGLDFTVTPDVLIPRPETELIVEAAIEILQNSENPIFCEVGVGSGCVAVSVLHKFETATAVGLDISENALQITKKNAEKHNVSERLNLKISDVFAALEKEKFDLIVSNPPYISGEDFASLPPEVRDFEPSVALTDKKDGLSIIKKIIGEARQFLKPKGYLLLEIGFNQTSRVREMLAAGVWQGVEILPDLRGIPRMLKAQVTKNGSRKAKNRD